MNTQGPSQGESDRSSKTSAKSTSAKSEHESSSHAQHAPGNGEMKGREHRDKQGNIHRAQTGASQPGSSSEHGESGSEPLRKAS